MYRADFLTCSILILCIDLFTCALVAFSFAIVDSVFIDTSLPPGLGDRGWCVLLVLVGCRT